MNFPHEGYYASKFIVYGEEVHDYFSREPREPVNVMYHNNSIVLTISGVDFVFGKLFMVI